MDDVLLMYYSKEWERFTTAMKYINNIFDYLVFTAENLYIFVFGLKISSLRTVTG